MKTWRHVQHVVFTPSDQMHEKYNLLLASCVTKQKYAYVHMHVANPTDSDVILRAGTNCGYVEPCDDNNIYNTYVTGYKVKTDVTIEQVLSEQHVHFNDATDMINELISGDINAEELNNIATWIKTRCIDVDLTQFSKEQQTEILLFAEFKDKFAQREHDYGLCNLTRI